MTIIEIKKYFIQRSDELITLSLRGDAWIFLCGASFIDYLSSMIKGDSTKEKYKSFIVEYLSLVNTNYKDFTYQNGSKDLPTQMYVILRCGIVHSFSFVPKQREINNGGRIRSILLAHEMNGHTHFERYTNDGMDSVVFTAEQFSKDLKELVEIIFQKALIDTNLANKILKYITSYPPILGQFS